MENINIKKVLQRIYNFDYKQCVIRNNEEFIIENGVSEFVSSFKKYNATEGIAVLPHGYDAGLFYKNDNGGEIYSSPKYSPDIVSFGLNIYGLKKGSFYKVTVPARSTGILKTITSDRTLTIVTDSKELVVSEDLTDVYENKEVYGIFRATSNEINLIFKLGKIFIKDIIIDEVELFEEKTVTEDPNIILEEGKIKLLAYGVFDYNTTPEPGYAGRYIENLRISGKGIRLYYDTKDKEFILERSNTNDVLNESFTNSSYIVDINMNKLPMSKYKVKHVSNDLSPNNLKQGYIVLGIDQEIKNEGKITILIKKIY